MEIKMFNHRIPFDSRELFFMAAITNLVLEDRDLFEEFSSALPGEDFESFAKRLSVFVERASERHPFFKEVIQAE